MDALAVGSWRELCQGVMNKEAWRERVRCLRQSPKVTIVSDKVEITEFSFTISKLSADLQGGYDTTVVTTSSAAPSQPAQQAHTISCAVRVQHCWLW